MAIDTIDSGCVRDVTQDARAYSYTPRVASVLLLAVGRLSPTNGTRVRLEVGNVESATKETRRQVHSHTPRGPHALPPAVEKPCHHNGQENKHLEFESARIVMAEKETGRLVLNHTPRGAAADVEKWRHLSRAWLRNSSSITHSWSIRRLRG